MILDEADAVLLDEARVPLVLAGESIGTVGASWELADLAAELDEGRHYLVTDDHVGSEWERIGKSIAKEIRLPNRAR